jgi:hypothetical protein
MKLPATPASRFFSGEFLRSGPARITFSGMGRRRRPSGGTIPAPAFVYDWRDTLLVR